MSQQFTLYNDLTAMQNIRFYGSVHGLPSDELRQRISEIIQMAGLEGRENTLTGKFVWGMETTTCIGLCDRSSS